MTTYTYDRLTSVTDHAGNKTTYTYDSVGNKASQTNPDGSVTKYTYDACNRLTSEVTKDKNGNLLADYVYAFNGNGQKIETREAVKSATQGMVATITTYTYDKANRLTGESKSVAREDGTSEALSTEYFYDSAGNRTKKVEDGVETEYTYNELNQLQSEITEGQETISYAYDTNGNLLCRGTTTEYETYTYTGENRLESVTITTKTGETKETYTYDAEGNRLSKTEYKAIKVVEESADDTNDDETTTGEVTTTWEETDKTYYVMDTSGSYSQVIAELDADKEVMVLYTRGDGIVSREEKTELGESNYSFYLSDGHGDVRQLTDETGEVTDSYRYNSCGELEESQGETENPYLYTGEYYDEGTGLYYLRARYMNPETGTFTSMDTYRGNAYDPASLHRYTYAQNNPQMYNDPSGHLIGLIGAQANMICSEVLRNRHAIHVMGMVNGMMNTIVNRMLGGEQNDVDAFISGYLVGAGMAAAYIGAAAIGVLSQLKLILSIASVASAVIECATSIVLAIAYGVTGHHKQALFYTAIVVICIIDICVELGVKGSVTAEGPRGKSKFDVDVESGTETTKLYRAMSEAEYESVITNNNFVPYERAMEEKWFATTQADATSWGEIFYPDKNYRMIEIEVDTSSLSKMYYSPKLDNIGPAYCSSLEVLENVIKSIKGVK